MSIRTIIGTVLAVALLGTTPLTAQQINARERAREPYTEGLRHMRSEAFEKAAEAFQSATRIDPSFEMAFYQLGRAQLALKQYTSAVYALSKSRDLYLSQTTSQFANRQEGQRLRREKIAELNELISDLQQVVPQTQKIREYIRQIQERKRQVEDMDRQVDLTPQKLVPAFVSLSLGSAYFRAGNLAEAEKAYLAAVAADPKVGEAHNNLAVVYMETGRYAEAERSVKEAEKTGLTVPPALKQEIARRKSGTD